MRSLLFAFGLGALGCALPVGGDELGRERSAAGSATTNVCWQLPRQIITGFGASSAWTAPDLSDELTDELYSQDRIGLSLLRMRIAPTGTTSETRTALKAEERGAAVWAAPWSPPGAWKTNGMDNHGGNLLPEHFDDWAERLASFVTAEEEQGVHLVALSAQNEPDFEEEWETCRWDPATLTTFVRDHLRPALDAAGVSPRILAPESSGWRSVSNYAGALLRDPQARDAIGIIATHSYNGDPYAYSSPAGQGKEFWMTEWSDDETRPGDPPMSSGLVVARAIHQNLAVAEVNAWHYWWLVDGDQNDPGGTGALVEAGAVTKRAYVIGQFSRFVRPGSTRLVVSPASPVPGVYVSAFLRETGADVVIVAVNDNDEPVTQSFGLDGAEVGELTPWVTNDDLALEVAPSIPGGALVSYELSPRSVTTFQGSVSVDSGAAPVAACTSKLREERSTTSGCSCSEAGSTPNGAAWLAALVALVAGPLRRRAKRRSSADSALMRATSFRS